MDCSDQGYGLSRHVFLHRTVMGRWLEAEFQCITPTSCRCSSSATARASHSPPQWVAAPWKPRDSSPSMLKGKMQFCIWKEVIILDDFDLTVFWLVVPARAVQMEAVKHLQLFVSGRKWWTIQVWCVVSSRPPEFLWSSWWSQTRSLFRKLKPCLQKLRWVCYAT